VAAAVGGVIGARLAWALLHPTETESFAGALAFYRGGLSVWGGLGGALLGTWLSSRDRGASLAELCDLGATGFGAGVVLTRLGCFLEGCDFGAPLGKGAPRLLATFGTFPKDSPAWVLQVLSRDLSPNATSSLPVHPTWLYEAMGGGVLVAVAVALGRRKLRPGFTFGAVLLGYLLLRVSLDSLRIDPVEMWVSRVLLGIAVLGALVFLGVSRFRSARK
jgi:phosphatidylglycerol:prolipoprotein diacylglycerol transferase